MSRFRVYHIRTGNNGISLIRQNPLMKPVAVILLLEPAKLHHTVFHTCQYGGALYDICAIMGNVNPADIIEGCINQRPLKPETPCPQLKSLGRRTLVGR